jgi:hypothetical protein
MGETFPVAQSIPVYVGKPGIVATPTMQEQSLQEKTD